MEHTDIKRSAGYYASRLLFSSILYTQSYTPVEPTSLNIPTITHATHQSLEQTTPTPNPQAETPEVVAQVLTHADGTLGSLYTFPSYRQRGLGIALVRQHLQKGRGAVAGLGHNHTDHSPDLSGDDQEAEPERERRRGKGEWAWTHIFHGNKGSEAVFRKLGFEAMWDVKWIYRPNAV